MKRFRFVIMVILAGLVASLVSGCDAVSQSDKKAVAEFYTDFVHEATSLNSDQISKVYAELSKETTAGQDANTVRNKMFARFQAINPDFFSKLHLTDSTYSEVGKTYSTILLLSLATQGAGIEETMPSDAVTSYQDDTLKKRVYQIDRTKITAVVPESLGTKITRPSNRKGLSPVKLVKDGDSWKVIADNNMLSEVGTPVSENITAPTTTSK